MLEPKDLQKYQDDGFLIVRGLFDTEQIRQLESGWSGLKRELDSESGQLQRSARFVFGALPEAIANIYKSDGLQSVAQFLLEEENIALYLNRLLIKDKNWNGAVTLHQDLPYFHGGYRKVSAFVPLQSHNEKTGGLKLLRGSHQFGNLGFRGTIHPEAFPTMEVVSLDLEVGDVAFMDFLTWHYSEEATVESERPLLQIVYQSATDGSYYGLEQPTLVAGSWKTDRFIPHAYGITADGPTSDQTQVVHELTAQLEQAQADLERTIAERHSLEARSHQLQAELGQALEQFQALESSKFWKVRSLWMNLKKTVGLAR